MKKTIPKLLTLVCLLVAVMGLSIVTAHAATVTGTVSSGNEYRYHEDKTPVSQWGPYTSNKLKYFTRNDTGETVPAYCMEPEVRSASGDLQYSSTSWSDLTWNQRYAVTLAMAYGYGGNYGFNMHPDCAQLATQAVVWEFVCGYRSSVYPYTLYDTTCANLFHYAGDDVEVAYNIIIDRIMNHGKIPSFAVRYRSQLSDGNAIQLTWDGSQYVGTATDTNGVLSQYYFSANISGVSVSQRRNVLTVTATKDAAEKLNGYISSDYGYSLDVEGTESVLLEPSNGSNYQACAALTSLPDPVWAYIHFKVNVLEEKGSITIHKVDATGAPLAGAELLLETSADGKTWTGRQSDHRQHRHRQVERPQNRCAIPYYRNQSSRGVCSVDRAAVRGNAGQQQPRCHHHCLQQRRICPTVHRRYGIYNLFPVCSTRSHGGCLFLQKI